MVIRLNIVSYLIAIPYSMKDCADLLSDYAQDGKEVMVAEALPKILSAGIPSPIPNGQMIPDLFEHHHVAVLENHRLLYARAWLRFLQPPYRQHHSPRPQPFSAVRRDGVRTLLPANWQRRQKKLLISQFWQAAA